MKKADVQVGATYIVKVSDTLSEVRLDRESPYGGWDGTNLNTDRYVRIRDARRLRRLVRGAVRPVEMMAEPDVKAKIVEFARKNFEMWRHNPAQMHWYWMAAGMADLAETFGWVDVSAAVVELQTAAKRQQRGLA